MTNDTINIQDLGAFGDGASHLITSSDTTGNPHNWLGTYSEGDEWDYVALQEAVYTAFGGPLTTGDNPRHTVEMSDLNRKIYIPHGKYLLNKSVQLHQVSGFHIFGDSRLSTTLFQSGLNQSVFEGDGVSYGEFHSFSVASLEATTEALIELDWPGDIQAALRPQQITLRDMDFQGHPQKSTSIGLRIAKSGANAQGDTILIENCLFARFSFAGLSIGTPTHTAYNALSIMLVGGDIQCPHYGVYCNSGTIFVDGTSFQPTGQLESNGLDIYITGSGNDGSSVRNVRSEGSRLVHTDSLHRIVVDNCVVASGEVAQWSPSTSYTLGAFVTGIAGSAGDGRVFVCVKAGTSGTTEPTWASYNSLAYMRDASITAASTTFTGYAPFYSFFVGKTIRVAGAGPGGSALVTTITSVPFEGSDHCTLYDSATTTVAGQQAHVADVVTDGTGTLEWMPYEFFHIESTNLDLRSSIFMYGQIRTGANSGWSIVGNNFSRTDWLERSSLISTYGHNTGFMAANTVTQGGGPNSLSPRPLYHPLDGYNGQPLYGFIPYKSRASFDLTGQPLLWTDGDNGSMRPQLGFAPENEPPVGSPQVRRLVAIHGAIRPLALDGGDGTDTTALLLWDVNSGSLKRVQVGAADSGGTGKRTLVIDN